MAEGSKYFTSWDELPVVKQHSQMDWQWIDGERTRLCRIWLAQDRHAGPSSHDPEQIDTIISGRARFRVNDEIREVGPGDIIWSPPNAEHEIWVLEGPLEMVGLYTPPPPADMANPLKAAAERQRAEEAAAADT